MRIIKEEKTERIHKCRHCQSIYAYLPEDIDHLVYDAIRCPVCNVWNCVSIFDKKVKNK